MHFKLKIFTFCALVFPQSIVETIEECQSKGDVRNEKPINLYTKEHNLILGAINKAASEFVPCAHSNCSCYENVVDNDLSAFSNGITKEMLSAIRDRGVTYQLINHKLYRSKDCLFPARCSGVEHFINQIRDDLDDFELVLNPHDWPQVSRFHSRTPLPILSFSKTSDYYDIMYPAWSFWEGGPAIKLYPRGLGRWDEERKKLKAAANRWPWSDKKSQGFFRGSRTSPERDPLVLLSRAEPQLVDAAYTKNQAWKSDKDTLGQPAAEEVSLEDHCEYKYLFNFRGVAASFRFRHLFLCRSLVFHVGDEWVEFFYDSLKPWVHYVPVKSNTSQDELRHLLAFFMEHDDTAKNITENGYKLIDNQLKTADVLCYWKLLLTKYSKLLKFKVTLNGDFINVTK